MAAPADTRPVDRPLVAVLATACGLRLAAVLWLSDTIPYSDFFYYHEAARLQVRDWAFWFRPENVTRYREFNWWPPGYSLFLASIYVLTGPDFRVAVFVQALLGTLTVGLVYAIGARAAGRRAGLVAAWLVALDPTWVFATNLLASENLFVVWFALGLWLAGRVATEIAPAAGATPARSSRRDALLTGLVFALATLTRAVGACVPFVVVAWLHRRAPRPAVAAAAAIALLGGFALGLAPWTLRNAWVAGTPALVCFGGGLNFYIGHADEEVHGTPTDARRREPGDTLLATQDDAATIDRKGWALGLRSLAARPLGFFTRGVRKVGALFAPPVYALHSNSAILLPDARADPSLAGVAASKRARQAAKDRLLHGPFLVLATVHGYLLLAGAVAACAFGWRRLPSELRLAAWVAAAWIVVHVVFWAQPRFRYPMDVPMALLAGWTVARWVRREPARTGVS